MGPPHSWLCITTIYDLTNCTWIWRDGHVPLLPVDIGSWVIRFFDSLIVSPRGLHLSPIAGATSLANWTVAALWFKVCPEDGNLVLKRLFLVAWTPVKAAINNFPSPFWITVCSRSAKLTPSQGLAFFLADNLPPYGKSCVNRIKKPCFYQTFAFTSNQRGRHKQERKNEVSIAKTAAVFLRAPSPWHLGTWAALSMAQIGLQSGHAPLSASRCRPKSFPLLSFVCKIWRCSLDVCTPQFHSLIMKQNQNENQNFESVIWQSQEQRNKECHLIGWSVITTLQPPPNTSMPSGWSLQI